MKQCFGSIKKCSYVSRLKFLWLYHYIRNKSRIIQKICLNKLQSANIKGNKKDNYYLAKYLNPIKIDVPGLSSAAFFTALTLLTKSFLEIKNVGLNPTRTGFYQLLKKQGAKIKFRNIKKRNNELTGDILIKSSKLKPINASKDFYTNTTDEYPILFAMAALINGVSTFSGISDLANKESNRIKEMQKILRQMNIKSKTIKNGIKIW